METVELDELEKLLGEIPNVTSGNPIPDKSDITYCQNKLSTLSLDKTEPIYLNRNLNHGLSDERRAFPNGQVSYLPPNMKSRITPIQSPRTLPQSISSDLFCFNANEGEFVSHQSIHSQSRLTYFHHHQVRQPHVPWIYLEEEHYRMHLQYSYMKQQRQLENQNQNQIPGNWTPPRDPINRVRVLDETSKMFYAEKNLIRPPRFQSLKPARVGSLRRNDYLSKTFPTRKVGFEYNCLRSRGSLHENDIFSAKIYDMAKDQNGCRFLQRKFDEGTPEDIKRIFNEIIMYIVDLMTDPFGNYLVQKLLEVCNEDQKMRILHEITKNKGELVRISCDMHGTRAVQKVIESLRTPEQVSMVVSSLKLGIVNLMKNMNGNHVAQCCLQYLKPEYTEFLFEAVASNCVELAMDRHGCCVLQKCLDYSDCEQSHRLIKEITLNALLLSQDQFGNYVVQFIFDIHLPWATREILDQLEGNYGDLSVQKYSSNVVEKCLKNAGDDRRQCIIQELIDNPRLGQIMQDPYGNYVIQAALNLSKGGLQNALVEVVKGHVSVLKTSPYGKKVLSCNSLKKY